MKLFRKEVITAFAAKAAKPLGIVLTLTGLFADFVKPYINFVPWFLVVSVGIVAGIWFVYKKKAAPGSDTLQVIMGSQYAGVFGFGLISTAFWLVMLPVFLLTPEEGVLSSSASDVAGLQEKLFGRFDRLEEHMDSRFDEVLKKLEALDANAGIINNPKNYIDHYHNARIYELTGNALGARQSFEKYFEANLQFFDPFISYAQILKSIEGPSATQEILGELRTKYPDNPAVHLAYAINKKDNTDQAFLLGKVKERFPDYGPTFFYLVRLNTPTADGVQTISNSQHAQEALARLDSLEKRDGFSKYFIDKKVLAEDVEFMRLVRLGLKDASLKSDYYFEINQIDLVLLGLSPAESVKKVFYRIDGKGEFIQTPNSDAIIDGEPYPETRVILPLALGKHSVEVKYLDREGVESTTETFEFDLKNFTIHVDSSPYVRSATEKVYSIRFRFYKINLENGTVVEYSIDSDKFNKRIAADYAFVTEELLNLSRGEHTVKARLKFPNGKVGEVITYTWTVTE